MEVHAPDHPVHTWRDFLRHIVIVTVGILIALALEGVVEWRHHRTLVREARENIRREIASNRDSLRDVLAAREELEKGTAEMLAFLKDQPGTHPKPTRFNFKVVAMSRASWDSAQATGALAFMAFEEVEHYAGIYDLQQHFAAMQQQVMRDSIEMAAAPDLEKASPSELADWRRRINTRQTSVEVELQIAEVLLHAYESSLPGNAAQAGSG